MKHEYAHPCKRFRSPKGHATKMDDSNRIPTNLRLLLILEILGRAERAMTPTEIGHQIGLPKQTVHRLCMTLLDEGFLVRDGNGKRLRPGRRTREMAAGALHGASMHIARHQVLVSVAEAMGETVNFVVPEDGGMRYIDRVETEWPFRVQLPIGTNVPFHCTASGKAYMASLAPKARERLVNALILEPHTENTITDPQCLLAELKRTAKDGFARDDEEFFNGMVAVAVPVHDPSGRYVASLACHGPSLRLSLESAIARRDVLLNAASRLQRLLFAGEPDDI